MSKRELGFRGFWIAVATVCVGGGTYLRVYGGHPVAGNRLVYSGLALATLLVFGVLAEWAASWVAPASNPFLGHVRTVVRFIVDSTTWLGNLLFAPIVRRVMGESELAKVGVPNWTAQLRRGNQGSDFLVIAQNGYRLAGGRFVVRLDYGFETCNAGFRLTHASDDPAQSELTSTVLVQLTSTDSGGRKRYYSYHAAAQTGPFGLANYPNSTPSFLFDFSIYRGPREGRLWVVYSINGDTPQRLDFEQRYAEKLVLVAWADGQDFRAHFEQISVSWTPTTDGT